MLEFLHGLEAHIGALEGVILALIGLLTAAGTLWKMMTRRPERRPPPQQPEEPGIAPSPRSPQRPPPAPVPWWKLALRSAACWAAAMVFSALSDLAWDPFYEPSPGPGFLLLAILTIACLAAMAWFGGQLVLRGLRIVFRN